jgi:hypothetical protein
MGEEGTRQQPFHLFVDGCTPGVNLIRMNVLYRFHQHLSSSEFEL